MAVCAEAQFHVLAVDDNLIDRKLIERLLKSSSYQVTAVDSVSKALEFLGLRDVQTDDHPSSSHQQEIEVNLIITDYCMPGMTGYDLLKRIKESSTLKDIPVVIMSSENVPSRMNRCLEEGAEEFFLKPVQLADVIRLRSFLQKGKLKELPAPPSPEPPALQHEEPQQPHSPKKQDELSTSKRKAADDDGLLSPERRKPRLSQEKSLRVET